MLRPQETTRDNLVAVWTCLDGRHDVARQAGLAATSREAKRKAHLQSLDFVDCSLLPLQLQLQPANLLLLGLQSYHISAHEQTGLWSYRAHTQSAHSLNNCLTRCGDGATSSGLLETLIADNNPNFLLSMPFLSDR